MNEEQFKNLLEKQKQNKLSNKEKELLNEFENTLISKNKENIFKSDLHKQDVKKTIQTNVNYYKKNKKDFNWLNIAASIVLLISAGVGFSYYQGYFNNEPTLVVETENIILQLENGNTQIIKEDGATQLVDVKGNVIGKQKGSQLVYSSDVEKDTLIYNTLTIPYGKRFKLLLSDGTNVHLNAGTSLKYPVKFIKGEKRQVFLNGEAYFSVAKDTDHPFIVNVNEIDVRVLGTEFNISSYPEDDQINTVLVEGSVDIYKKDEVYNAETATNLKPGFKATWQKTENKISVEKANIEMHTAWIDGRIIFRCVTFKNMIKKLERHYNVVIVNNNKWLNNEEFGASFDIETIDQVFETLNTNYDIDYTIEDNQIIIN